MPELLDPTKFEVKDTPKPTLLDPSKYGTLPSSNPTESNLAGFNFDVPTDHFKRFVPNVYPEAIDREAATNQSVAGKFGNMFTQGIVGEILGQGVVGGIGGIIGVPQAIHNELTKGDADFNNFLTQFANDLTNTLQDKFPILRYNPNKSFDWKDPAWWANNGVSTFSSLGMLIPALGEEKVAGYFAKALKAMSEIQDATKLERGISKGVNAVASVFDTEKYWQKLTHSAITMRNAENFRESNQTFNNVKTDALNQFQDDKKYNEVLNSEVGKDFLSEGRTPSKVELANFIASKGAWRDYATNAVNVVFDAMQLAPIFKGFKVETRVKDWLTTKATKVAQATATGVQGAEAVAKAQFNTGTFLKGAKIFLGEQVGEGVEELVNAVAQNEGNHYGKMLLGQMTNSGNSHQDDQGNIIVDNNDLIDRFKVYARNPSTWEQAFWGFAGGVIFSGATRAVERMDEIVKDYKDPHRTDQRIEEINNRYVSILNHVDNIKKTQDGIDINTNKKFEGTPEEIKKSQEQRIDRIKTSMGYTLGFNASRVGNVQLLLDMIEHPNFKQKMIEMGVSSDGNFDKDLAKIKSDIVDAEHTYKNVYGKIFVATTGKEHLRDLIIGEAINQKAEIKQTTKLRDNARQQSANLRTNNPALEALKEQNKDKDFDGTLDNLINARVIATIDNEISKESDPIAKKVMQERAQVYKDEFKIKDKELKDTQATGDFNSVEDIINSEAEARLYDIFLHKDNSLYEEVVNTNKSISKTEGELKLAVDIEYGKAFDTFRNKIREQTNVDLKVDNTTTLDEKIAAIDKTIEDLNKSKVDPFADEKSPVKKLNKEKLDAYIDVLNQRRTWLAQQKTTKITEEQSDSYITTKNNELTNTFNKILKDVGVTGVEGKFTGKRHSEANKYITQEVTNLALNPNEALPFGRLVQLVNDSELLKEYTPANLTALRDELNNQFNQFKSGNLLEEIINELLVNAGYIVETKGTTPEGSNKAQEHIDNAQAFKDSLNTEASKNIVDFTSQNPITTNVVDRANKWITGIVNDGENPLFKESPDHGTQFKFETIAARYGELVGANKLREDFDALKQAYTIIRNSKINPETGQKRIYNTDKTLAKITIDKLIEVYGLNDEYKELQINNINNLTPTGGEDVVNTFVYKVDFTTNENGDQVVNDKDLERVTTLLNGVAENSQVIVQINTELSGLQGFSQNKNDSKNVPIIVKLVNDKGGIPLVAIPTLAGIHNGVKYNFDGKDWTDDIINDASTTNSKLEYINRLMPLIQAFYNAKKMKASSAEVSQAYSDLLDADVHGILYDLVPKSINLRSNDGMTAFIHISNVLFHGMNTEGVTPIAFKRNDIIANVIRWKDKLIRDQIGYTKIREILGTDIDKVITSKVKHITSGTLVKSQDSKGNIIWRNLSVVNDPSKVQFYIIQNNSNKTVVENTRDNKDTVVKQGLTQTFSSSFLMGVSDNRGNKTVVPVQINSLNGKLLTDKNSDKVLEEISNLIINLGKEKALAVAAFNSKDQVKVEEHQKNDKIITDRLKTVLNIQHESQGHTNELVVSNHDIRFKSGNDYYVYDYYSKKFRTERTEGKNKITKVITPSEFTEALGNLNRNVNYQLLGGKPFTDILGNKHNSYEEYLVNSNTVVTDIGQLVDKKGNKISNFTLRQDGTGNQTPLSLNIDTSKIKTETNTTPSLRKFTLDYQLDKRYNFATEFIDTLIRSGKIKFNGVVSGKKIDKETGNPVMVYYTPSKNSISITQAWVDLYKKDQIAATLALMHDMIHALNGTRSKEEQTKLTESLDKFRDDIKNTPEYKELSEKVDKNDIDNKILTILNMKDSEEILTYGLTDIDFARYLDTIKSTEDTTGKTFWSKLKDLIREIAKSFGISTKLDELNNIFNQFIGGEKISSISNTSKELLGEIPTDTTAQEYADEFGEDGVEKPIISFEKDSNSKTFKPVSYSSTVNKELTGSPFEIDEEKNILNVLSNITIERLASKYKGVKGSDVIVDQIRTEIRKEFWLQYTQRKKDGNITPDQETLILKALRELRDNDKFWKYFRIHLSNQYGYNINEQEDYIQDIELLEKSWDQTDVLTKNPLSTVADQIKNLINRTYEVNPNLSTIVDGKVVYRTNEKTPTGFANTLNFSEVGNKLIDLMRGSLTKEDMLTALFNYASDQNTVLSKSLYNIHKELSNNPELLNAWFTSFDKAILDSYRDLTREVSTESDTLHEININHGNKNAIEYFIANEWTNNIVSKGENGFFDKDWYDEYTKQYKEVSALSSNFSKLPAEAAAGIVQLYNLLRMEVSIDNLNYEFKNYQDTFINTMIAPLRNIAGIPGKDYSKEKNVPYIVQLQTNPKVAFNEFGNLLRFASKVKYFREDHFNFSSTNLNNNLVFDATNPSFLSNFFKKLEDTDEVVFNALVNHTKILSNQHSLLLWGDQIVEGEIVKKGRGIFDYTIVNNIRQATGINKENLGRIKSFGYEGTKDLNEGFANEYADLTKHDWTLKNLIYYFGGGETIKENNVSKKLTAIFPLINPSDRKNTRLFESPIVELSRADFENLLIGINTKGEEGLKLVREIPIFKAIYLNAVDELIAMNTAKQILFQLDNNGRVLVDENQNPLVKQEILDGTQSGQIYYHYKEDENGNKVYCQFVKKENGHYGLDTKRSGNIFDLNNLTIKVGSAQTIFSDIFINGINFTKHLLTSDSLNNALHTPLNKEDVNSTFKNRLEQFILNFVSSQIINANNTLTVYKDFLEKAYVKKENLNREEKSYILKDKQFNHAIAEYALNSYLFNIEQVRLFYGSVADYKSNVDLNKRGGQVIANGIPSVHKGIYYGATINDVKLKSKVYRHKINTVTLGLGYKLEDIRVSRLNKQYTEEELKNPKLFTDAEREVYNIVSPYLSNDSANAVSLIRFDEFVKRISGFGLTDNYKTIINKVRNGQELDRGDTTKFASMQKNFYYSMDYNEFLQKMVPTQVKNAEVVLTPALIKDLQLENLDKMMDKLNLSQINLRSAEKEGSLYIANIADEDGNITDDNTLEQELTKATRSYNYEGLRMQLEVSNSLYEDSITMSRQFVKKVIENIPDELEYKVKDKKLQGNALKQHYFDLINSNIYQDACRTLTPFDVRVDKNGRIIGELNYDNISTILEKEGIDRNLTKNIIYSITKDDEGRAMLPIFFNTNSNKWENILTSLFTNGVTNQKFPGLKAAQMSSLFMNKQKGVKWSQLTSTEGVNWHKSMEATTNVDGKEVQRKDLKLHSTILYDEKEGKGNMIQEAEVLLPRWAKQFYKEDANGKKEYVDINTLSDEVRTMIGYRIPMEAKYSAYVFKVVGFLPDDNGPSIVLPDDFVTQTGSDFDMDTVYAFIYGLQTNYTTETVNGEEHHTPIVERIPFIEGDSLSNINSRVQSIMQDRSQLVHVLSTEYNNKEITDLIVGMNKAMSSYFELIKDNPLEYKAYQQYQNEIKAYEDQIAKATGATKTKLIRDKFNIYKYDVATFDHYKESPEFKDVEKKIFDIISSWNENEQNTKKARENRIMDVYYGILTNPYHYQETIATSNFNDITNAKKLTDKGLSLTNDKINNLTIDGQQDYREKSHQGRDLKGISLALDRFNSIAQVARINLTEKLNDDKNKISKFSTLPVIEYLVTSSARHKQIQDLYGDDVKFEKRGVGENINEYAIVTHRFIGNNPTNTFKNVEGKLINSYSAQTTANILDNVAFPLPSNINEYTVSIWKMLVSLGSNFETSTSLINQPIIRDLTDTFFLNANNVKRGSEIEQTKRKFQTLLYRIILAQTDKHIKGWDTAIEDGKLIFIGGGDKMKDEQYKYLGYENGRGINLNSEELLKNINTITFTNETSKEVESAITDKNIDRLKEVENQLRYQLQILETFKHLKSYSDAVTDGTNTLNTDKIGAGPTFSVTRKLLYDIKRTNEQGILEINGASAMSRIFPKYLLGKNSPIKSSYPTLEHFLTFSNLLSLQAFSRHFIGESQFYTLIKEEINKYTTDKKYDDKLTNKLTSYLNNSLLKDLPWLNDLSIEEKRTILGIETELDYSLDLKTPESIEVFNQLSVANQVELLRYHNDYGNDHLLNHLRTRLQDSEIKKYRHHQIEYVNNDIPDTISQTFNDLWYSDNEFERVTARNLLRYEYIVNGFGFGYTSFSKIIPNTLFSYANEPFMEGSNNEKGIGLSDHLYNKLDEVNNLEFDEDEKNRPQEMTQYSDQIFNSNYKERFLKSNWQDDNIVPNAALLTRYDKTIQNEDGSYGRSVRYFQVRKDGIIVMPIKTLDNIPTGKIANKVKERDVIKLNHVVKNADENEVTKWQLYQAYRSFIDVDEWGNRSGTMYYYPINKLEKSENEERSIFEDNNQFKDGTEIQSPDDYIGMINHLNLKESIDKKMFTTRVIASNLQSIREGKTTAFTVGGLDSAEVWSKLKVGEYVQINLDGEYVKVTKPLMNINLTGLPARLKWAEENQLPIERLHEVKDGIEHQNRTDLFEFHFEYVGNLDAVMKDANATFSNEGDTDEDFNQTSTTISSTKDRFNEIKQTAIKNINKGNIGYYTIFRNIQDKEQNLKANTKEELIKLIDETISPIGFGNNTNNIVGKTFDFNVGEDEKGEQYRQKVIINNVRLLPDNNYNIIAKNKNNGNEYNMVTDQNGSIISYTRNGKTFKGNINDEIVFLADSYVNPISDIKPVSYTSSTNQSINNAIDSVKPFIDKTTGSYANRIKILTGVGTLKDAVKLLGDKQFQVLIEQNDLATLATGLTTVLKQYDFDLSDPKTETKKGGILARLNEFENMDMNTILTDAITRKSFTGFLSRTHSFFMGATSFDLLKSVDSNELLPEEKVVTDVIKQLQNLLPTINNAQNRVDALSTKFYEQNLQKFTSNPEILAGLRKIMDVGDDESYVQLKLDALADTNNPFVANMVKQYMVNMINGEDDASKNIGELEGLLRKAFAGKNITSLTDADFSKYLETKDGKRTGKLIQKYDMDKFYADKKRHFQYLIKTYGAKSQSYYNGSKAWYNKNEQRNISDEEFENIVRQKKEDLSASEFTAWKKRNIREVDGEVRFLVGDSSLATPSDLYINPKWTALKDDKLYQKFVEILTKYTDYFGRATVLNKGFIPTLQEHGEDTRSISEKVKDWIAVNKIHDESEHFVGENDEMVYRLTIPMVDYFSQEKEIEIPHRTKDELQSDYEKRVVGAGNASGKGRFKTIGEVFNRNKEIKTANDAYHAGKLNYNLADVFTRFIKEATTYKVKADMKHEYDLGLFKLRDLKFNKRQSTGEIIKNKAASKILDKNITGTVNGEGTNIEKHYAEWLEAIFYGNFDIEEGAWTTISKMLMKYTSMKNMWFNMTAGVNNVIIGKIQIKMEAFAGWYFKSENLRKADKMYISTIPDIISSLGSTRSKTLTGAIIKKMDITQNTNERDFSTGMLRKQLFSWSSAYFMNDMGEHYMQNVSTLAMLDHYRIINGNIKSLADYQFDNYKEALQSILNDEEKVKLDAYLKARFAEEEFKEAKHDYLRDYILTLPISKGNAFVEAKKVIDKDSLVKFEVNPKLHDAFYLDENGYAQLQDEVEIDGKKVSTMLNENEYAKFRNKAVKVVQKQQGIYNKEDANTMSRRALGKMVIQFRKYMRPGWNKRFGTKFGKSFWTESRDEYDKGSYVSLYRFLTSPLNRTKVMDDEEGKQFQSAMGRIMSDYGKFITNIGIYWNTLDDFEKGNIKRALLEFGYLAMCLLAGAMVKHLKPTDDDKDWGYDLTAYEIDRALSELMMYTPFGVINEGTKILKSPAAVQGTAIDLYKAAASLVSYPFQTDKTRVYSTGVYKGDTKLKVNTVKLVPIWNKVQQIQRINKFNKYYILFRG
jgi:hypothetical protein